MGDDLERRLDAFYRGLDDSARRVERQWKGRTRPQPGNRRAWVIAGAAAAAAVLLTLLALQRPGPARPAAPTDLARPSPLPELPPPIPAPEPGRPEEPRTERPSPVPAPPVRPPEPRPPEPPKPEEPKPLPVPPAGEPRKTEPRRATVERAVATIREAEGAFDLGERALRGKQKDFAVAAGDRLKAATVVRLTLADDRFVLLSPRSVVEFRPEEKRLTIAIDSGDLHAELIGAGPEVRVSTRTCEVHPLGTVFTVRAEERRSSVTVERGRVEVLGARGKSTVRPGESVVATDDGAVSAPSAADFRTPAWAKPHRAAEPTLFFEDFNRPGAWKAEFEKGVARGVASTGAASSIQLETDKPIFEVPLRGQVQVVCRSDRASRMYAQFFVRELRVNFRKEVPILRGAAWRTVALDFDEFLPMDKAKHPGRAPAGSLVYDFGLYYGEEGEKGSFWVDSIKVVEVRP